MLETLLQMNTGARGIYVTRRPSLLGDYQPSCDPGSVVVDLYGDGSQVMCVPRGTEGDIVAGGGRVLGYTGSSGGTTSAPPTAQPPMYPGAPAPVAAPSFISQIEHTTGLSGSSLAIGMVVLLLLTRKR